MTDINKHVARYLSFLEANEKGPSPEEILARLGPASNPGMMGIFATHLRKTMMDIAQRKIDAKKATAGTNDAKKATGQKEPTEPSAKDKP